MKITLKEKDIKDTYSDSGMLIDELAYSIDNWTSNDLYKNNLDYEPREPYQFDFETDLFNQTKTPEQLYSIAKTLEVSLNANWQKISEEQKLQAGACVALNNPEEWANLLSAYTEAVKEQSEFEGNIISELYQKELEEARENFHDDLYKEWLHGDRDSKGIIREIGKYYGGESVEYSTKKQDEMTFTFEDGDIEETMELWNGKKATIKNVKEWLLIQISNASNARQQKEKKEREARKIERERLAIYKAEQSTRAEEARKAKLLAMTLN